MKRLNVASTFLGMLLISAICAEAQSNDFTGNIYINTTTLGSGLNMSGGLMIDALGSTAIAAQNNGVNAFALNPLSSGAWTLYDNASGSWTPSITSKSGNIGIGLTSPIYPIDVTGSGRLTGLLGVGGAPINPGGSLTSGITIADPYYPQILLDVTSAGTNNKVWRWIGRNENNNPRMQLEVLNDAATAETIAMEIDRSGTSITNVQINANLKINGSGAGITFPDGSIQSVAYTGGCSGGDYAESVDVTGARKAYEPGDVMVIDPDNQGKFLKSAEPYSTLVAGIYSTKPGVVGRRQTTAKNPDEVPMAMVGIVPTKVSAENGPIKIGDLLVTSSTMGYAMKGTDRSRLTGAVVGKALGSLDTGAGVIEVLVTLQ